MFAQERNVIRLVDKHATPSAITLSWVAAPEGEDVSADERRVITPAEREARKAFREADGKVAMSEHESAQKAFRDNFQRLKAERLAREAESKKAKPRPTPAAKRPTVK